MKINVTGKNLMAFLFAASIIFVFSGCTSQKGEQSESKTSDIQPLTKHWEKVIPHQEPPEGLESLSASECGECHEEIYREWKSSNHARALQDPQFQAEWAKDEHLWVCINCHTPLQNQQEFIILGKEDGDYFKPVKRANPNFDHELKEESVTCAVCHVRDGAVIGTRGNDEDAPHAVKKDTEALSRKLCFGCHNVTEALNPTLICTFQTGEEWKAGPYPQAERDCISCHMPAIFRPLTAGSPARWTRRHIWIGSAVPKFPGDRKIVDGYQSGLVVRVSQSQQSDAPGDSAFFTVSLINQNAGHKLPTGDPEYYFTLEMRVTDEQNNALQDTTFFIGQKWEWWPKAKKLSDNRLKPLEQRDFSFAFSLPAAARKSSFETIVTMHRMSAENAKAMGLLGKYPISAVVYRQKIPLRMAIRE